MIERDVSARPVFIYPLRAVLSQERLEASVRTGVFLASPTKGQMELIVGRKWVMVEESLPELSWVPDIDDMGVEQRCDNP